MGRGAGGGLPGQRRCCRAPRSMNRPHRPRGGGRTRLASAAGAGSRHRRRSSTARRPRVRRGSSTRRTRRCRPERPSGTGGPAGRWGPPPTSHGLFDVHATRSTNPSPAMIGRRMRESWDLLAWAGKPGFANADAPVPAPRRPPNQRRSRRLFLSLSLSLPLVVHRPANARGVGLKPRSGAKHPRPPPHAAPRVDCRGGGRGPKREAVTPARAGAGDLNGCSPAPTKNGRAACPARAGAGELDGCSPGPCECAGGSA